MCGEKTLGYFNVCEARRASGRRKLNFFHHPVQSECQFLYFILYIINPLSALTLHLNSLAFLIFGINFHLTEVLEQPSTDFSRLTSWRYVTDVTQKYVNKGHKRETLTQPRPNARPRSRDSVEK